MKIKTIVLLTLHHNFISRTCFVCSALHTIMLFTSTQRPLPNGGRLTLLCPLSISVSWELAFSSAACRPCTQLNAPEWGGCFPFEAQALLLNTFLPDLALKRRFWNWACCELPGSAVWSCIRTRAFGTRESLSSVPWNPLSWNLWFIYSLALQKGLWHHLRSRLNCMWHPVWKRWCIHIQAAAPPTPITSLSPEFPAIS